MLQNEKKMGLFENIKAEVIVIIETMLISLFVVALVFTYLVRVATVNGSSMEKTMFPKEKLIAWSLFYKPERGDIIIADTDVATILGDNGEIIERNGLGKQIVKRVIATGGQTLDINFESGEVYVDGNKIDEPYITALTHMDEGAFTGKYPITIPEGYLFVMGDNRPVSKDSRSLEVGLISEDAVTGEVFFRVSPASAIGFVH